MGKDCHSYQSGVRDRWVGCVDIFWTQAAEMMGTVFQLKKGLGAG